MGLYSVTIIGSAYRHTCIQGILCIYAFIEHLPRLFLKEEERNSIEDFVILRPHWLINVMTVVVEIKPNDSYDGIANEHILPLKRGVAYRELFEHFLNKSISGSSDIITLDHLLLILRSYCLIFPLQPALSSPEGAVGGASCPKYIVPCKLPDDLNDNYVDIPEEKCCVFYFDFCQFLPDEIYHRLMCLASTASKPKMGKCNKFYKKHCVFYNLHDTNWIIKLEREKHRMKFAFL